MVNLLLANYDILYIISYCDSPIYILHYKCEFFERVRGVREINIFIYKYTLRDYNYYNYFLNY